MDENEVDPEIVAIEKINDALSALDDPDMIQRVLTWAGRRFNPDVMRWNRRTIQSLYAKAHGSRRRKQRVTKMKTKHRASDVAQMTLCKFLEVSGIPEVRAWRFLATAVWLQTCGAQQIHANDINDALQAADRKLVTAPGGVVLENARKGFIKRAGATFTVTAMGKAAVNVTG